MSRGATFARPARAPDYSDRFAGPCAQPDRTARELAAAATRATPGWFRALFALRQRLARIAGLKTGAGARDNGLAILSDLPVIEEINDRFAIGMADRHLDFALTVTKTGREVAFVTDIWFNAAAGRVYLALVLPFHKLILRRYVRALGPEAAR